MTMRFRLLCVFLVAGCSVEDPGTARYDAGVLPEQDLSPDGAAGCPAESTLTVVLDAPPAATCLPQQPFRGRAMGADRLVVTGGSGASQPVTVGADGRFCIEVALTADSANAISFHPIDAGGCPGQSLVHTIQHKGCDPVDATAAADNVALGATVLGSGTHKGQAVQLVDGKLDTVVEYQGGGWGFDDAGVRVQIALGKPFRVEKIVVRWRDEKGDGCDFGKEYKLHTAAAADAGKLGGSSWSEVESISGGDGGEDSFTLAGKPKIQHVGLRLNNNGCQGWHETFALREVEVWGRLADAASLPPDRCL
jgi:hypothetical protein